ncbi:MAG: iron ABC transporter permease, partial [Bacteroidales bacterium]|nr:iron ABC transporter permease [Bacteroidales bacterium]
MSFIDKKKKYRLLFIAGLLLLLFLIVISATIGAAHISLMDAFRIMAKKLPFVGSLLGEWSASETHELIVLNVRLPRILAAAVIGIGLSVVGAAYQSMFVNPMADPYVLGVSSGAALGASIAIVLGAERLAGGFGLVTAAAFIFALLTVFIVFSIAKTGARISSTYLLLAGVAVSFFATSLISVLMVLNRDRITKITYWMMGSVAYITWKQVLILIPVITLGTVVICFFARDLNIIVAGEEGAKSLGV